MDDVHPPPANEHNPAGDPEGPTRWWSEWDGPEPLDARRVKTLDEARRVFFSRKGPRFLLRSALSLWGVRALFGPPRLGDALAVGFVVAYWPFQEWALHKHILHRPPRERNGQTIDNGFAKRHRAHHRHPYDVDLAMLPRSVLVYGFATSAGLWFILAPNNRVAITGLAAQTTMTLVYEWVHYITHTNYKPNNSLLRWIRRNHRRHHFYNEQYWHTFTFPPVDTWLGSNPELRSVGKSETACELHGLTEDDELQSWGA